MLDTRKVRMTELFPQWERQANEICRLESMEHVPLDQVGRHNDTIISLVRGRFEIEAEIARTPGGTPLDALRKLRIALHGAERSEVADWKPSDCPRWRMVASALEDLQAVTRAAGQAGR